MRKMIDHFVLWIAWRLVGWVGKDKDHTITYNDAVEDARRAIGFVLNIYYRKPLGVVLQRLDG